ncbi:RapZ C-terminal domain-containing protein [Streptomyces sp. WAC00288]|uniref:RapZ C-terminal domain-containing protein n=1 Tax=Streptomyces sp. WAC00288 TaxID=2094021 RepID=UPI00269AE3A0|nr:ATPase [Streptomyces sp. WAC00288]
MIDLRHHFRDPHLRPELRYLTAHDQEVCETVLATAGIEQVLQAARAMVQGYLTGPARTSRSPSRSAARAAGTGPGSRPPSSRTVRARGLDVHLVHRDLDKDVVKR